MSPTRPPSGAPVLDAVVVGAGPAGLGTAAALAAVDGLEVTVLERGSIGQTFHDWPADQRFLTPSFTGNGFGATDLNAIHPDTSPAFSLGADYPDGPSYARYLRTVAAHLRLHVLEQAEVVTVEPDAQGFVVGTTRGRVRTRTLVWAGGEFHDPVTPPIEGADLLDHSGSPVAWERRSGDVVVVGGYESGIDLACHHVDHGASVTVVDAATPWDARTGSDPSFLLAPRTRVRLRGALSTGRLRLVAADAAGVSTDGESHLTRLSDGAVLRSSTRPLSGVGFGPGLGPVAGLFQARPDGWPLLDRDDQSTITPGLFLAGPTVRHDRLSFCFVYKFRQRFAHCAATIGGQLGKDVSRLETWRAAGMLIDDLSCCGLECAC